MSMQHGKGSSGGLPERDLGPIKARLRRWYQELPDLYATAEFGINYICREVTKWAPSLGPELFWRARVPFCGLIFDILYGWLDGKKVVLFSGLGRLLPPEPYRGGQGSNMAGAAQNQIGPFFDLGLFVYVPNNPILNKIASRSILIILPATAEDEGLLWSYVRTIGMENRLSLQPASAAQSALAPWTRRADTARQTLDAASDHVCACIVNDRVQRIFLPQHVPRTRTPCFLTSNIQ